MQGPMLKVAPPQCLIIESFIYISCCRKYIRMMNGLRPFAELCMDGCFADFPDLGFPTFAHTTSPGRYQYLAQAIQPDQTSSRIKHAPTRPRNPVRETQNQWANLGG